jgi:alpha-amylase
MMLKIGARKRIGLVVGSIVILLLGIFLLSKFVSTKNIGNSTPTDKVNPPELVTTPNQEKYGFDDPQWWEHAVFYEIFVRSFYDSNGDGIGDFNGITQKLDYLNDGDPSTTTDLGINAIWLMPIFPSPSYHGYDVTDYFNVNPEYGTLEDFNRMVEEAHKRGIHVIIDFVINHTSSEHPWFVAAQDPVSEFHDWYIWSETNPGYLGPWNEKVWHPSSLGTFYYGVFSSKMPDLNYTNPNVTVKMEEAAKFWLDMGVDGFRVDGARHLIEEGEIQENTKSTIKWFQNFALLYKEWKPSAMTVGEIWDSSYITTSYLNSNCFDMVFDFDLANSMITTITMGDSQALSANIDAEIKLYNSKGMGTFLTNHDMNRVMSVLGSDIDLAKHAATILLTIPGTPFIYYGEEIGMVGMKPDEQIRSPMQWSSEKEGGFTTGRAWQVSNFSYKTVNVENQINNPDSLLSLYRGLIQTRLVNSALLDGEYIKVETSDKALYAALRVAEDNIILTLVNLQDKSISKPVLKFKGNLPPGTYIVSILVGNGKIDSELNIVKNGDLLEITLNEAISPNQDLVLQLKLK